MDGQQTTKSDRSAGLSVRKTRSAVLAAITAGGMLISFSGCAFTRTALLKAIPEANPGAGQPQPKSTTGCMCPNCAAPQHVMAQQFPDHSFTQHPQNAYAPAQTVPTHNLSQHGSLSPSVPQGSPLIPPAASMPPASIPDAQTQTQTAWPSAQQPWLPPVSATVPASAAELSQCQKQMEELNQQVISLQETTERSQQAMVLMAVEQSKLQQQNQRLQKRAEKTDQQYLESMESLSAMIGEVISPPAGSLTPVPSSPASSQKSDQNLPAILLPSVDESP